MLFRSGVDDVVVILAGQPRRRVPAAEQISRHFVSAAKVRSGAIRGRSKDADAVKDFRMRKIFVSHGDHVGRMTQLHQMLMTRS